MGIRAKIILIVLPLLITSLVITGVISSFSARNGITRVAMQFFGFKAQELEKYAENQWNLLLQNDLTGNEQYVEVTKDAVQSYAESVIRSGSEIIFAVTSDGKVGMATSDFELRPEEREKMLTLLEAKTSGWVEISVEGTARVGNGFYFPPFDWYVLVTEENNTFFKEVREITVQSGIILGASLLISVILILIFTSYLTGPIKRISKTMKDIIAQNDLSQRVRVEFQDEIGGLAHNFNIMISQLEKAYQKIKEFALQAVVAQKNEHKIRNIFQKYVPKDVIDNFFSKPEAMLIGENRVLAILFSDIRSFTTISEGFMPDELVTALNQYFEIMVDIIMNRGGIIDKYIGDAIMAFFGAPVKHEDDALQAVMAAIEMQEALAEFNEQQTTKGKPAFLTGIGINYGVVTVGNIGSERKMDYTIIGDMVNLGSRLEGLTKPYKQGLIFSESVYRKVKNDVPCRLIDKVVVKGKTQGEKIFTAKRTLGEREKEGWAIHHTALRHYYKQEFKKAKALFEEVHSLIQGDHIAGLYIERCDKYIAAPPPQEWNGMEVLTSK